MNRVNTIAFRLLTASLVLCWCFAAGTLAQTPERAPQLPAGMKGSDANDPRAKLSPGLYDAGEAAMGIKHLMLLKKPDAFQLGSNDPNSPKVKETLGSFGINDPSMIPESARMGLAQLAFANSDLAFQGNHLFMGNFYGVNIIGRAVQQE